MFFVQPKKITASFIDPKIPQTPFPSVKYVSGAAGVIVHIIHSRYNNSFYTATNEQSAEGCNRAGIQQAGQDWR